MPRLKVGFNYSKLKKLNYATACDYCIIRKYLHYRKNKPNSHINIYVL